MPAQRSVHHWDFATNTWSKVRSLPLSTLDNMRDILQLIGFALTATVGELDPNPVRHLARCGTTMLAARLYAREATNHGASQMRVLLACAIIITTAVGLAGCFHHQQATYAEPIARPPLK